MSERKKGYETKPEDDMTGHGMAKSVTFKFIDEHEDGSFTCTEVDFYAEDMLHRTCGSTKYLWLWRQRNGIYECCAFCKSSTGPISREDGITKKSYQVSIGEVIEILRARGWKDRDKLLMHYLKKAKKDARRYVSRPRPPQ